MNHNNDAYKALLIETTAKDAHGDLISFLTFSDIFGACYAYKSRVKARDKLIEKKERKQVEKPSYCLESIRDVIGLRLVTLFRRDMPEIVGRMAKIISHADGTDTKNPFVRSAFDEVVIYSVNPRYDDIIHQIKSALKEHDIPDEVIKVEQSKEGYSSIHLVSHLDSLVNEPNVGGLKNYFVPIEIQIRTVFEDAWGEIDHKYGYVIRAGKDIGYPISNPEFVLKHLKVLKKFSDACAEYADIIYSEANPGASEAAPVGAVISVAADDLLLQRFRELGIQDDQIEAYSSARKLKEAAKLLLEKNLEQGIKKYMLAAEGFREIFPDDNCQQPTSDQLGKYLFYYYVRMNEAICLLSTNQVDGIKAANAIYAHLEEAYKEFPLLKMRVGQAIGKLGNVDQAIVLFREAKSLTDEHQQKNKGAFDDALPEADFKHISSALPVLLGFHLWRKFEATPAEKKIEKLKLLEEAIVVTEGTVETALDDQRKQAALNNVVCYLIAYLECDENSGDSLTPKARERLANHIVELEALTNLIETKDIEVLDTFAQAYSYIGATDKAIGVCDRIHELALEDREEPKLSRDLKLSLIEKSFNIKKKLGRT